MDPGSTPLRGLSRMTVWDRRKLGGRLALADPADLGQRQHQMIEHPDRDPVGDRLPAGVDLVDLEPALAVDEVLEHQRDMAVEAGCGIRIAFELDPRDEGFQIFGLRPEQRRAV